MPQSEPSLLNQVQIYRPPCSRCGGPTALARIEPSGEPGYDLRTFECRVCSNADTIRVAYN